MAKKYYKAEFTFGVPEETTITEKMIETAVFEGLKDIWGLDFYHLHIQEE